MSDAPPYIYVYINIYIYIYRSFVAWHDLVNDVYTVTVIGTRRRCDNYYGVGHLTACTDKINDGSMLIVDQKYREVGV